MNHSANFADSLDLMRKLIEHRQQKALHHQLMKTAERSMLGIDAIVMLYHCAKVSVILEIGSYVRGATIAMATGVRDSGTKKKIISIERGCRVDHPRIGTRNSFKDLRRNLKRFGFLDEVSLINGRSLIRQPSLRCSSFPARARLGYLCLMQVPTSNAISTATVIGLAIAVGW